MMDRYYPNTPAGSARRLRDGDDAYLTGRGHCMKWRRGTGERWLRGVPGWTGRCERCGDVIRLAALGSDGVFRSYEDAAGRLHSMRKCKSRRR